MHVLMYRTYSDLLYPPPNYAGLFLLVSSLKPQAKEGKFFSIYMLTFYLHRDQNFIQSKLLICSANSRFWTVLNNPLNSVLHSLVQPPFHLPSLPIEGLNPTFFTVSALVPSSKPCNIGSGEKHRRYVEKRYVISIKSLVFCGTLRYHKS